MPVSMELAVELAGQCLQAGLDDATAQTQDQMEGRLLFTTPSVQSASLLPLFNASHLLDVVVAKGATVLELLAGEDEALLVGGDALLVLDLRLYIVDGVARLHLEGDSLARQGLDENLHRGGLVVAIRCGIGVGGGLVLEIWWGTSK